MTADRQILSTGVNKVYGLKKQARVVIGYSVINCRWVGLKLRSACSARASNPEPFFKVFFQR